MRPPGEVGYVALGANLGPARLTLLNAMNAIDALPGTRVTARSSIYRSAPVDATGPDYLNAVVALRTTLDAQTLLDHLHRLEDAAGRQRSYRNAPRTIDLDLLLLGQHQVDSPTLVLPHPRMWERAFVVLPLSEIAPAQVSAARIGHVAGQDVERLR